MQKFLSIKSRKHFKLLKRKGFVVHTPFFLLSYVHLDNLKSPLYGIIVTKKIGNAVARNKIKRRIRAIVQITFPDMAKDGFIYLFIAKKSIKDASFAEILYHTNKALDKCL